MSISPFEDLRTLVLGFSNSDTVNNKHGGIECRPKSVPESIDENGTCKNEGLFLDCFSHLCSWLAMHQDKQVPQLKEAHLCLLASSYEGGEKPAVIQKEIAKLTAGKSKVSAFCVRSGLGLRVFELAVDLPHCVDTENPTWTEQDVVASVAFGMETAAAKGDLLGLAGLAPGGEDFAKCVIEQLSRAQYCSARKDTGSDVQSRSEIAGAVDPLVILRRYGGRDIAALMGGIIAARVNRLPVLIEGWPAIAAVALLEAMAPGFTVHVKLACVTDMEQISMLTDMNLSPVIGTIVDVGPGCGLALAVDIIVSAAEFGN